MMKKIVLFFILLLSFIGAAYAQQRLPLPEGEFRGTIADTFDASRPDYGHIPVLRYASGAPNVVLILLDDVGYGFSSLFGGGVSMPALSELASKGLRYTRFHTAGVCTPTRAALLTGRNAHVAGTGSGMESGFAGFPGRTGIWPKSTASVAEILRQYGYSTAAFGKWHNTPVWEASTIGPFDRWPTGQGFEYFYGFVEGETNQWAPTLFENTRRVQLVRKDPDYHLTSDLAQKSIDWIESQHSIAPEKPFFVYFAPGAAHAPHHAPKDWINKYRGKFDKGWDVYREEVLRRQKELKIVPENTDLTSRPEEIPAWASLSDDQKRLYARMMEVYAGFLSHADHEIGRLIGAIDKIGALDNTIVIYVVGDNGGSTEGGINGAVNEVKALNGKQDEVKDMLPRLEELGGPNTYGNFPVGWAWAGSAPFSWTKIVASHFGAIRNPLVISWPKGISDGGGIRTQFHHVIDLMPTILQLAGISAPAEVNGVDQKPIDGISMAYTFAKHGGEVPGRRHTQYFEVMGNKGIYHDGWFASNRTYIQWRDLSGAAWNIDEDKWELYNMDADFSQAHDLADELPGKLEQMKELWVAEASRNQVFPIHRVSDRDAFVYRLPGSDLPPVDRKNYVYYSPISLPFTFSPRTEGRSYTISADIDLQENSEGVLVADGGRFGGYSLFIQGGKVCYTYNVWNEKSYKIISNERLQPGKTSIRYAFSCEGDPCESGEGALYINDRMVGKSKINLMGAFSLLERFDVGKDLGTPVSDMYESPFPFTGKLSRIEFNFN